MGTFVLDESGRRVATIWALADHLTLLVDAGAVMPLSRAGLPEPQSAPAADGVGDVSGASDPLTRMSFIMPFEARILGPVEASLDGRPVSLGSPKQRAVFALLVLSVGRVVSTERLISELWGEDPPASPVSTLQVYISRLRRSVGGGDTGPVRLVRRPPGYQLTVQEGSIDAHRFREFVDAARARVDTDPAGARTILETALRMQRGAALADVVELLGPDAAAEAQRLDELRLAALQLRLGIMLAQGDTASAVTEANALVRAYPLQEELHAALMLALYRAGRQAEALQAFEAVRNELAEQLGVDPSPTLRALQLRILRQDLDLDLDKVAWPTPLAPPTDPPGAGSDPALERHEALPPDTPGVGSGQIPKPLTSLQGRDGDVQAVGSALETARLTSLTGTGGAGKTRLAIAVVSSVSKSYPGGIWWVDLAAVSDPSALPRIIGAAVGGRDRSDRPPLESVVASVGTGRGLLVLDSCEHLVAAVADVVHRLLVGCPELRVLVTTREPVGVPGELIWLVPPLEVPPATAVTAHAVAAFPAAQLWSDRATSALPSFRMTDEVAGLIGRICRRLDGLPLALELAAARLRVLSLEEIADALDRLDVLSGHDRSAPDRHRTLRATLDWSFRLLTPAEQQLLAELSVFSGGFTLAAVAGVRASGLSTESELDLVSRLIDRSMVFITDRGRPTRYRLLETVRVYASDVLDTAGRTIEVGARHLAYFLALAEEAERHLAGPDQDDWLGRLDADVGNFVAALRWSVGELREPEAGLRLVTALWRFWYLRGRYSTGREWLDAALRAAGGAPTLVRAQALAAAGQLAYLQCDYRTSSRRLEEARDLFASRSDPLGVATVLQSLGCVAREQGAYVRSRELHMESQRRFRLADHAEGVARAEHYLGFVALLEGDLSQAEEQGRRAQPWFRAAGDGEGFAWSLLLQGAAATYAGELDAAERLLQESLRRSERTGYREGVAWSLNQLGVVAARRGEQDRARTLQRDSLGAHWQLGDLWRTASALEALAGCESRPAHQDWATHLLGAAVTLRRRLGAPIPPVERPDVDAAAVRLQTTLGERYAGAHAAGRADELEQTVRRELGRVG